MTQTTLDPSAIRRDSQTQIRVAIDPETVTLYELLIRNADYEWPFRDPIVVFDDGAVYWMADGFQRDAAWCNVFDRPDQPVPPYPVEIRAGTLRDAVYYATHEANRHGQPYTRKDRRNLVQRLVADPEWTTYSNRQIARIAGVDEKTIRNIRKELAAEAEPMGETSEEITAPLITPEAGLGAVDMKSFDATVPTIAGAESPHLEQAPMFDPALEALPVPALALPAIYAPVEAYQIVALQTPLACTIIDTEKLELCGQPATMAFAWLVEDEREGAVWKVRPVCGGCVAVGS